MRRSVVLSTAVILLGSPAAASAATKTVDMGLPVNQQKAFQSHGTDANDFFPHGVTVHAGDSVRFVPAGFHNVDIPARGKKPQPLLVTGSAITGSLDAAGAPFWFNGQTSIGFNPAVAGASGLGKHFSYTGAKEIQSGLPKELLNCEDVVTKADPGTPPAGGAARGMRSLLAFFFLALLAAAAGGIFVMKCERDQAVRADSPTANP